MLVWAIFHTGKVCIFQRQTVSSISPEQGQDVGNMSHFVDILGAGQ